MITGITIAGLVRFFTQASFAVSAAASLWVFVFLLKSRRTGGASFEKFAELLTKLFIGTFLLFLAGWITGAFYLYPPDAFAHEGIRIIPLASYIQNGFQANLPLVMLLLVAAILNLGLFCNNKSSWKRLSPVLWLLQFLLLTAISFFTIFNGTFGREQLFFFLHNWHSILTFGGVVIVDFLFLATAAARDHRKALYDFFFVISAFIWLGLGLDFLSNLPIFEEGLKISSQFFFVQTVVAILIINGTLLSGRITEVLKFLASAEKSRRESGLAKLISISGAVSIVSWTTITFVDFFTFDWDYWQFLAIYLVAIFFAYSLYHCFHRGIEQELAAT